MYFDIFSNGQVNTPFTAQLDASADVKAVCQHFTYHPARWNTAFRFLSQLTNPGIDREQVIRDLHRGRTDLSADVYVNVEDYIPKPIEQCRYESHRRYIDIQYVAQGCEYIGMTCDNTLPVLTPYDADKDIAFYPYQPKQLLLADPTKYFIFFPTDLHAPCIQTDPVQLVTKIVVKILL